MLKCLALRNQQKILNITRSLHRLADRYSDNIRPSAFARGFYPSTRFINCYIVIFTAPGDGWVRLAREAAATLEKKHGLVLDWAAGYRWGKVYLLIKALARDRQTFKARRFRLDVDDIKILRIKFGRKGRERER